MLAECLRRAFGAHVELWELHHGGRLTEDCNARGIPWRVAALTAPVGTLRYWGQLARLALRLRRARPDVLLPYTTAPNVACGVVWRLAGAGACVWNQRDLGIDRLPGRLERRAVRSVSAFVANSRTGADYLVRTLSAPAERVHVVRNGVSPPTGGASRIEWRARIGARDADLVACMVRTCTEPRITRQCSARGASSSSSGSVRASRPSGPRGPPRQHARPAGGPRPGARCCRGGRVPR